MGCNSIEKCGVRKLSIRVTSKPELDSGARNAQRKQQHSTDSYRILDLGITFTALLSIF